MFLHVVSWMYDMTDDTDGWIDDWMTVTAAQSDVKCSVMVLCIIVHHYIWIYYLFFPLFIFFFQISRIFMYLFLLKKRRKNEEKNRNQVYSV